MGIVHALRGLAGPDRLFPEASELDEGVGAWTPTDRTLVDLLLLGRSAPRLAARAALTEPVEHALSRAGLLVAAGPEVMLPARIVCASPFGWLLADAPFGYPGVVPRPARAFADDESLPIARALSRAVPVGDTLDLGCGAGLTTLAAARSAARVVAVDIVEEAADAAQFGIAAADIDERVDVRTGDLYDALRPAERFDRLVAVLPALPLPDDADAPAHAGGRGGSAIAARVVRDARRWLRSGGEAWIGGAVLLDGDRIIPTPLLAELDRCGAAVRWSRGAAVDIGPASGAIGRMLGQDNPEASERWAREVARSFRALGATAFAPALFLAVY